MMNTTDQRIAYLVALEQGTALVQSLVQGRVKPEDFFEQYDDFFYTYAFHGDEASEVQRRVIDEHAKACKMHEEIQRIAYLVYRAEAPIPGYETAGRMLPTKAAGEIIDVANKAEVSDLLAALRRALTSPAQS